MYGTNAPKAGHALLKPNVAAPFSLVWQPCTRRPRRLRRYIGPWVSGSLSRCRPGDGDGPQSGRDIRFAPRGVLR